MDSLEDFDFSNNLAPRKHPLDTESIIRSGNLLIKA